MMAPDYAATAESVLQHNDTLQNNRFCFQIDRGISTGASWHAAYADSAYVYAGGLDFRLTEGDVITIFSQVSRS